MTLISTWPFKVLEPKDPDAVLDYVIDWSDWLEVGEVITFSEWTMIGDATITHSTYTDTTATVWISGGTATFSVTNEITTDSVPIPRKDNRTLTIKVKNK